MMRVNRVGVVLQVVFQAVLALALAVGASLLLRLAGTMAMLSALLVLLTLFFFFALALLRVLPARHVRQFHRYDPGDQPWRRPYIPRPDPPWPIDFGDQGGVREPRRPFPPRMPPRAVAAEPETPDDHLL